MKRLASSGCFVISLLFMAVIADGPARAGLPRDWTELDGLLDRTHTLQHYQRSILQPADGYGLYLEKVRYTAEVDSLGPEQWPSLAAAEQDRRRSLAANRLAELDRVRRTVSRLYNSTLDMNVSFILASDASMGAIPRDLLEAGTELVLDAMGALVDATGLAPVDPEPWADLGYFAGLIGDSERQRGSLDTFRSLHDAMPAVDQLALSRRRARACLDLAWTERELGHGDRAVALCLEAQTWIDRGGLHEGLLGREARLVAGLARAEQGRYEDARELAVPLDDLPFHQRNSIAHFFGYAQSMKQHWSSRRAEVRPDQDTTEPSTNDRERDYGVPGQTPATTPNDWTPEPVSQKGAWQSGTSDWARDWVHAIINLHTLDPELVLHRIGEPDPLREYPPGLAHRYWNDFGLIYEQIGRHDDARRCYAAAAMYRPYLLYYPFEGRQSRSLLFTDNRDARVYYAAAGRFYTGGDLYAYAAGCVLAWEFTDDADRRDRMYDLAEETLTACRNRGIRPTAALAQRGRLRYLAGDLARAGTDLELAIEEFDADRRDHGDLLLMLGLVHFNGRDFPGAAPWLDRFSELRPEEVVGWLALGLSAAHMGHLEAADKALSRVVDLRPEDPGGWFNRGLVRIKRGQGAAALADMEQALILVPGHADILRVTELLEAGELPDIALQTAPIVLGTSRPSAVASEKLQRVHLGTEMGAPGVAAMLAAGLEEGTDRTTLEAVHLHDPSASNRALLARRYLADGRPELVQGLLAPIWDRGLGHEELLVLMAADRELGHTRRATSLVHGLQGREPTTATPAVWQLVGVICLEAGLGHQAERALQYAESLLAAEYPGNR